MGGLFPESGELRQIVERTGWSLHDVTGIGDYIKCWEELDLDNPAETYQTGKDYVFAPPRGDARLLSEADYIERGLGPCLNIVDPGDYHWCGTIISGQSFDGKVTMPFMRLWFDEKYVFAFSPPTVYSDVTGSIGIEYDSLVRLFDRDLGIIEPDHYPRIIQLHGSPGQDDVNA